MNPSPTDRDQDGAVRSYLLRAGQSGTRIPMRGKRYFSCPFPWGPPSLLYSGYRGSFSAEKRPVREVGHSLVQRLRISRAITSRTALCLLRHVTGWPTFTFTFITQGQQKKTY